MEDLLKPLKTTTTSHLEYADGNLTKANSNDSTGTTYSGAINCSEDAIDALRSKPNPELLDRVLRWLNPKSAQDGRFNINSPGPQATQIIHLLVNDIIPTYWKFLRGKNDPSQSRRQLLIVRCLSSIAGIGAVTAQLRSFLALKDESQSKSNTDKSAKMQPIEDLLEVLDNILKKDSLITTIWKDISSSIVKTSQNVLLWKEFLYLVATGRILSLAAEANRTLNEISPSIIDESWLGNGNSYTAWLGRNIENMIDFLQNEDVAARKALARCVSKALSLGYTDQIIGAACSKLLQGEDLLLMKYRKLMHDITPHEQRVSLYALLRVLSRRCISASEAPKNNIEYQSGAGAIGGAGALITGLIYDNPNLQDDLIDWLSGVSANGIGQGHNLHRAVIAALSSDEDRMKRILQKSLDLFGDKLYIKHTPILHQEINAQVLLMTAGYVHRGGAAHLSELARSSTYLNAISNRLNASSQQARFLGMVVGAAFSELVDSKDKRMIFSAEEVNSPEGQWYQNLTQLHDQVGLISDLRPVVSTKKTNAGTSRTPAKTANLLKAPVKPATTSKIISIEEVDSTESDDEDLVIHEKPDSDESDEDEDPTLIQRDKPTAPVYIRDLIAGLRDTENYDRHQLSLSTASSLIRRKASFGTEVSDHIEELATLLVGLSDKYEMEKFQELRLQGMIAVLHAQPLKMGQWFSKTFYNGDYSMGQRASVLTTLGMGARELAGFRTEDAALTGAEAVSVNPFPSRKLPDKLHKIYALEAAPMDSLAKNLERTIIQPMAIEAADNLTGPNALKVRTFSSRMEVEKKRKKAIPNELAKIVADGFFFPLTGRWRIHMQAYGENNVHFSPFLLTLFLKTLSLILHASGASTLSLPQMTAEFWDLLLSLRSHAVNDVTVLEALLFAFLTLLDINENKQRIAEEHAKELLETQGWVEQVFERMEGGAKEGERVRMLAAGVLVRTREVVEKYQRLLLGDLADFM